MKYTFALFVIALAASGTLARPSEKPTEKFPKKFDSTLHGLDKKKSSTYVGYEPSKNKDKIQAPPVEKPQEYIADLTRTIPGFVPETVAVDPSYRLLAPVLDTYSTAEGEERMVGFVVPSDSPPREESKSYSVYNVNAEELPLIAPAASSYSMLSLEQLAQLISASVASPSGSLLPPADSPAEGTADSSYVNYNKDADSQSSYLEYEQPQPGNGDTLSPPPIA